MNRRTENKIYETNPKKDTSALKLLKNTLIEKMVQEDVRREFGEENSQTLDEQQKID